MKEEKRRKKKRASGKIRDPNGAGGGVSSATSKSPAKSRGRDPAGGGPLPGPASKGLHGLPNLDLSSLKFSNPRDMGRARSPTATSGILSARTGLLRSGSFIGSAFRPGQSDVRPSFLTARERSNIGTIPNISVVFLVLMRMLPGELGRMACVSKSWRKVANDDTVWTEALDNATAAAGTDFASPRSGSSSLSSRLAIMSASSGSSDGVDVDGSGGDTYHDAGPPSVLGVLRPAHNIRDFYVRCQRVAASMAAAPDQWSKAARLFNTGEWTDALAAVAAAPNIRADPADCVHLIFHQDTESEAVGVFLGLRGHIEYLDEFFHCFTFAEQPLDEAFADVVSFVTLPADKAKIDQFLRAFAARWFVQNATSELFASAAAVYTATVNIVLIYAAAATSTAAALARALVASAGSLASPTSSMAAEPLASPTPAAAAAAATAAAMAAASAIAPNALAKTASDPRQEDGSSSPRRPATALEPRNAVSVLHDHSSMVRRSATRAAADMASVLTSTQPPVAHHSSGLLPSSTNAALHPSDLPDPSLNQSGPNVTAGGSDVTQSDSSRLADQHAITRGDDRDDLNADSLAALEASQKARSMLPSQSEFTARLVAASAPEEINVDLLGELYLRVLQAAASDAVETVATRADEAASSAVSSAATKLAAATAAAELASDSISVRSSSLLSTLESDRSTSGRSTADSLDHTSSSRRKAHSHRNGAKSPLRSPRSPSGNGNRGKVSGHQPTVASTLTSLITPRQAAAGSPPPAAQPGELPSPPVSPRNAMLLSTNSGDQGTLLSSTASDVPMTKVARSSSVSKARRMRSTGKGPAEADGTQTTTNSTAKMAVVSPRRRHKGGTSGSDVSITAHSHGSARGAQPLKRASSSDALRTLANNRHVARSGSSESLVKTSSSSDGRPSSFVRTSDRVVRESSQAAAGVAPQPVLSPQKTASSRDSATTTEATHPAASHQEEPLQETDSLASRHELVSQAAADRFARRNANRIMSTPELESRRAMVKRNRRTGFGPSGVGGNDARELTEALAKLQLSASDGGVGLYGTQPMSVSASTADVSDTSTALPSTPTLTLLSTAGVESPVVESNTGTTRSTPRRSASFGRHKRGGTISFMSAITKSGWLQKQRTGVLKTWDSRWFVLRGNCLFYYHDSDAKDQPQGIIPLAGVRVTRESIKGRHCIRIGGSISSSSSSEPGDQTTEPGLPNSADAESVGVVGDRSQRRSYAAQTTTSSSLLSLSADGQPTTERPLTRTSDSSPAVHSGTTSSTESAATAVASGGAPLRTAKRGKDGLVVAKQSTRDCYLLCTKSGGSAARDEWFDVLSSVAERGEQQQSFVDLVAELNRTKAPAPSLTAKQGMLSSLDAAGDPMQQQLNQQSGSGSPTTTATSTAAATTTAAANRSRSPSSKRLHFFARVTGRTTPVSGGGSTPAVRPIFGMDLDALAVRDGCLVPQLVSAAIHFLTEHALNEEGLLRLSGSHADMDRLRLKFEGSQQPIAFDPTLHEPHTVAGLLKQFFRELPEPIVPAHINRQAALVLAQDLPELSAALQLRDLMVQLSPAHMQTARAIIDFLRSVIDHSIHNRMHKENVLTVIVPTLSCVPMLVSIAIDCPEVFQDDEELGTVGSSAGHSELSQLQSIGEDCEEPQNESTTVTDVATESSLDNNTVDGVMVKATSGGGRSKRRVKSPRVTNVDTAAANGAATLSPRHGSKSGRNSKSGKARARSNKNEKM